MRVILATADEAEAAEMKAFLSGLLLDTEKLCFDWPDYTYMNGGRLEENALRKARFALQEKKGLVLAESTGLHIGTLGGRPGALLDRRGEEKFSDEEMIAHHLNLLSIKPENSRDAMFRTVLALMAPNGRSLLYEAEVKGEILMEPKGFGAPRKRFATVFKPKTSEKSLSEMTPEELKKFDSRQLAYNRLRKYLATVLSK